ncbi:MAG: hypothetical protein J1E85_04535 [Ruminococcus sp.]|nr:hypothetical protein [Ruminococcus sp.]
MNKYGVIIEEYNVPKSDSSDYDYYARVYSINNENTKNNKYLGNTKVTENSVSDKIEVWYCKKHIIVFGNLRIKLITYVSYHLNYIFFQ